MCIYSLLPPGYCIWCIRLRAGVYSVRGREVFGDEDDEEWVVTVQG